MTYSKEFRAVDTAGHSLTVFWNKIVFLLKIGVHEGESVDEKSDKEWHKKEGVQPKELFHSHKFFYVLSFITQSFPHGFSWTSNNITASTKKNISKSLPVYPRWLYIYHLQKIIIIPVLCQYGLPIHTCASENAIVSKDMIF